MENREMRVSAILAPPICMSPAGKRQKTVTAVPR